MPFESSLPLVLACTLGAIAACVVWTRLQSAWLLAASVLLACGAAAAFTADRLVVTEREYLRDLFPRLAEAAETQDVAAILAALDPDIRPLRDDAERVLRQVRPTEVVITKLEVAVDGDHAVADMIVRVTGNVIDQATPGTVLVGVKASLRKKSGRWLVTDADGGQIRPGRDR